MSDIPLLGGGPQEPQAQSAPQHLPSLADRVARNIDRDRETAEQLRIESFRASINADPGKARRAARIAGQLGMDPLTTERTYEEAQKILAVQDYESAELRVRSPTLAQQMEDPLFARQAARDDEWKNLSLFERTTFGFEIGRLNDERGMLGGRLWLGVGSDADIRRIAEIDVRRKRLEGASDGFFGSAGEIAGSVSGSIKQALGGAIAVGSAAIVAGQLGPQIGLPEELLTVPTGITLGALAGFGSHALQVEAGNSYVDLIDRGVSPGVARFAAGGVGAVNAALEMVGARLAAAPIRATMRKVMQETIAEALIRPTLGKAAAKTAIGYAKSVVGETVTEIAQEVSNIVAEGATTGDWDGVGSRLGEVALKTAQGMALLGIPGSGMQFAHEMGRVRDAQRNGQQFERMQTAAGASKLRTENPEAFQEFAEQAAQGTGAETVWIDAAQFAQVLRQGKAEVGEGGGKPLFDDLEKVAPGLAQAVLAEEQIGGDIAMPSSVFLTKLTGTEVGKALTPHVRFDREGLSTHDAEKALQLSKEMEGDVEQQADRIETAGKELRVIEQSMATQIEAAGRGKDESRKGARVWSAFVATQSQRLGMTPAEFQKANNLKVQRGEVADADALQKAGDKVTSGFFDPKTLTITLTGDQDSSTFLHEVGHAFLSIYSGLAQQKADPRILDDFRTFLSWAGEDEKTWHGKTLAEQRVAHEKFAEAFEAYLLEGRAPTPKLQKLFDRFAEFLREIYAGLRGDMTAKLSPEIRGVMDRMLASDEQVRATQAIRGAVPLFQTEEEFKEAGGTAEQWAAHQEAQQRADAEASMSVAQASVSVMRWLSGAKGKLLRQLQSLERSKREGMRGLVAAQIQSQPVYRAARWLKTGEMVNEDGTHAQGDKDQNHKIRTEDVTALGLELPGMTSATGLPADTVATFFGFDAGEQLVRALATARPIADAIETRLDERMLMAHSKLADPEQRAALIEKALHGPARQQFVAAEYRALSKTFEPERVLLAAAREAARAAIDKKRVVELTPRNFTRAAAHAAMESQKALRSRDIQAAAQWKRIQMRQSAMHDLATEARAAIEKARTDLEKLKRSDEKIAKERDIDIAYAAQALAAAYKLAPRIAEGQRRDLVNAGLAYVQKSHPNVWARLAPLLDRVKRQDDRGQPTVGVGAPQFDNRDLTVGEFREVVETVEQLWDLAKSENEIEVAGKKVQRAKAHAELVAQLGKAPPPPSSSKPTEGQSPGPYRRTIMAGWSAVASQKRWEHEARNVLDGGQDGPFQRYLLNTLMHEVPGYRAALAEIVQDLGQSVREAQERHGSKWHAKIAAPDLVPPGDVAPVFRGVREVLGFILHLGTDSNAQANLVARGWAEWRTDRSGERVLDTTRVDAFLDRMVDQGFLDPKKDGDFLEKWWGTFRKLLPQAQKAHKARFGAEYKTLTERPVVLGDRVLKGGYVPKRASRYEADPRMFRQRDVYTANANNFQYSVGSKPGFALGRDENYRPPLTHDVAELLSNVDEELRFIHLELPVAEMEKLLRSRREVVGADGVPRRVSLEDELNAFDRNLVGEVFRPWAQNTAQQITSLPTQGGAFWHALDAGAAVLRNAATLLRLGANLGNALVQMGGALNVRSEVQGKEWRAALRFVAFSPRQAFRAMTEKSVAMEQEYDTVTRDMRDYLQRAALGPTGAGYIAVRQFGANLGRFLQTWFQAWANMVAWHAGYAEAIGQGKSEQEAVARGDQVFRMTQETSKPENRSAAQVTTKLGSLLTQFSNYSGLVLSALLTSRGRRRAAAAVGWLLLMPALYETAIKSMIRGTEDEDDDESKIDDFTKDYLATVARNTANLVPVLGPMATALVQSEGVRVQESPASGALREIFRGVIEAGEAASGDETTEAELNAVVAVASWLSGFPLAAPVRTVQQVTREER